MWTYKESNDAELSTAFPVGKLTGLDVSLRCNDCLVQDII